MSKNIRFQDPYSFITRMIERLDGGTSKPLDAALDLLKRGKPDEATAILITFPLQDLTLGCVIPNPNVEARDTVPTIPDVAWLPEFIKAALAKPKKPSTVEEKKK